MTLYCRSFTHLQKSAKILQTGNQKNPSKKTHRQTSERDAAKSANDELQKQQSLALVFSPAAAQLCHVELSSNNNV